MAKTSDRSFRRRVPYSPEPMELSVSPDEFPDAAHVGELRSNAAIRLGELHIIGHQLDEAVAALGSIRSLRMLVANGAGKPEQSLLRAMLAAFVIVYCRCFKTTGRGDRLVASEVFAGDATALREHEHFWDLRDRHFAHDVNGLRQAMIGGVFDAQGKLLYIASQQMLGDGSELILNNGTLLVAQARAFLERAAAESEKAVEAEIEAMSPDERLSLPVPVYHPVKPDDVNSPRSGKRRA